MAKRKRLAQRLLPGEREWLAAVVANLSDDAIKLVYADWLDDQGDDRATFLRIYAAAAQTMNPADCPKPKGLPEEWLELIGFRLFERLVILKDSDLKRRVFQVVRPALRMKKGNNRAIDIGASKIGGLPDLPPDYPWPVGDDCRATYNNDTASIDQLAGFVAQVNLGEVADTLVAHDLPRSGVLSFFCYQDLESDPDVIGVKAIYFENLALLMRTKPPGELVEGNEVIPARRLMFEETLDLPVASSGPWARMLEPVREEDQEAVFRHFRSLNFENVLGYARSTTGDDPTPSKSWRHLILLENAVGCRLHIQITQANLSARKFDKIKLVWVDFD